MIPDHLGDDPMALLNHLEQALNPPLDPELITADAPLPIAHCDTPPSGPTQHSLNPEPCLPAVAGTLNPLFYSQVIAAADPTPFNKPRFISWPSVCDTTRTNWLVPPECAPSSPSTALQNHVEYACLFNPESDQPLDQRILDACSSIDCFAPPADPSLAFTAIAAPPPVSKDLYTTVICAPGVSLHSNPTPSVSTKAPFTTHASPPPRPKTGRPLTFDTVKRREFCAMVRTGCSLRNAAKHAGVNMASVSYACRTDPAFAAQLRAAEQQRDLNGVRRINNAGEKSWRAAAWVLERADPNSFSLRPQKKPDVWKSLGKRRFKQLIAEVLQELLPKSLEAHARKPMIDAACQRIDERLAEMEAQCARPLDPHDDDLDDDERSDHDTPPGEQGSVTPPKNADQPVEDPAVEAAAQAVFQQLRNLMDR